MVVFDARDCFDFLGLLGLIKLAVHGLALVAGSSIPCLV
jgi:hypothetical protein